MTTHMICRECWDHIHPHRDPYRAPGAPTVRCCMCNLFTSDGIVIQFDHRRLRCQGEHPPLHAPLRQGSGTGENPEA